MEICICQFGREPVLFLNSLSEGPVCFCVSKMFLIKFENFLFFY